jgi:hypothetical protein
MKTIIAAINFLVNVLFIPFYFFSFSLVFGRRASFDILLIYLILNKKIFFVHTKKYILFLIAVSIVTDTIFAVLGVSYIKFLLQIIFKVLFNPLFSYQLWKTLGSKNCFVHKKKTLNQISLI